MISFMKDWVLNIAALVMFIVIVEMLMPSGKMKKYLSLVTGFVLIIAIINPFLKFIGSGAKLEDIQISNSNFIDKYEIEKNSSILKDEQNKQIIEVYRKKLIKQLEDNLSKNKDVAGVKGDVIINEDYNSENFGEILRVYAEITTDEGNNGVRPVAKVEKIEIGNKDSKSNSSINMGSALKKQLEDRVTALFGIDRENIVISRIAR